MIVVYLTTLVGIELFSGVKFEDNGIGITQFSNFGDLKSSTTSIYLIIVESNIFNILSDLGGGSITSSSTCNIVQSNPSNPLSEMKNCSYPYSSMIFYLLINIFAKLMFPQLIILSIYIIIQKEKEYLIAVDESSNLSKLLDLYKSQKHDMIKENKMKNIIYQTEDTNLFLKSIVINNEDLTLLMKNI